MSTCRNVKCGYPVDNGGTEKTVYFNRTEVDLHFILCLFYLNT